MKKSLAQAQASGLMGNFSGPFFQYEGDDQELLQEGK